MEEEHPRESRQERRDRRLERRRRRMRLHGASLRRIYLDAIRKRRKRQQEGQ